MKVSILGVGFIGDKLLDSCVNRGYDVSVLDHKPCPDKYMNINCWVNSDFSVSNDVRQVIRNSDVVYHLISSTVPSDDVDENEEIMKNVSQTINFLKLCVKEKVKKVIFISSSSVYGIQKRLPINEKASTNPISSHGIHKLTIEKYIQLYKYQYGLDCKIMRLSNPYGEGQNIFGRQGIIAISVGNIIRDKSIIIHGNGKAIRDFIYIDDVIAACHLLESNNSDEIIFNIGSGQGVNIREFLLELQNYALRKISVEYIKIRANDISASILDISRANKMLDFKLNYTFKSGLKKLLKDYSKVYPEINNYFNIDRC